MEKTIGQRIKECRLKLGMTQQEFAEVMYMPKSTISAYENITVYYSTTNRWSQLAKLCYNLPS